MTDAAALLNSVIDIARQAGQEIMKVYADGTLDTTYKTDLSPVTQADLRANQHIMRSLRKLTPTVPIISEESLSEGQTNHLSGEAEIWMVDPLDGTKDFLKHNGEFTVNIALIRHGEPILGVVYAPAMELLYYAVVGTGVYKQNGSEPPVALPVTRKKHQPLIVTVSRSHLDQTTEDWLEAFGPHKLFRTGSSLKFCYLADGTADVYPRLSPIMEWDIAAADAILRLAGGSIIQQDNSRTPLYNKPNLHQPPFIATSPAHSSQMLHQLHS